MNEAVANLTSVKRNGVWSVSCVQHGFIEDHMDFIHNEDYRIPSGNGIEIYDALVEFMKGGRKVYIDEVSWP